MNYEKIYENLVNDRKIRNKEKLKGMETHHILPKHAGGDDSEENLVNLTYREHTLAHRLLYKIHGRDGDYLAYRLMSGLCEDRLFELRSLAGKLGGAVNKQSGHMSRVGKQYGKVNGQRQHESGFLDEIRKLVNKDVQKAAASKTGRCHVESGFWRRVQEASWEANRTREMPEEELLKRRAHMAAIRPTYEQSLVNMEKASKVRAKMCEDSVQERIKVAPRIPLARKRQAKSSKYLWHSPEGLVFNSPQELAYYYGFECYEVENFCKRNMYNFSRSLKPTTE